MKEYKQPIMKVIQLQQQAALLEISGGGTNAPEYYPENNEE
jgi:hypothetical protein